MKLSEKSSEVTVIIMVHLTCLSAIEIPLIFNQCQCNSITYQVTTNTTYYVYWYGDVSPKLCTMRFHVQPGRKLCYQAKIVPLPDVQLIVTNSTLIKKYYSTFSKICIKDAYNATFSLDVRFTESKRPREYIKLVIVTDKDTIEDIKSSIAPAVYVGLLAVASFVLALIVHLCNRYKVVKRLKSLCREQNSIFTCCIKMADCLITVGLKWKSCVEYCKEQNHDNFEPYLSTESQQMTMVPELNISRGGTVVLPQDVVAAQLDTTPPPDYSKFISDTTPPPDYSAALLTTGDPTAPPPSYEDVVPSRY